MGPSHLFAVGALRNSWLATRQSAVATNIANANTPDFKTRVTTDFQSELSSAGLRMTVTNAGHFTGVRGGVPVRDSNETAKWDILTTQSPVRLEKELMKIGEINRSYSLNTGVMSTFHRMVLASTRG